VRRSRGHSASAVVAVAAVLRAGATERSWDLLRLSVQASPQFCA